MINEQGDYGEKGESYGDVTLFHVPVALVRRFKEFCRLHARNKFGIGLELLLNAFAEKESYLFLMDEVKSLREDVTRLQEEISKLQPQEVDKKKVKTFGGIKL